MISENKRLSLLIRKNYGRHKLGAYKRFFEGFNLRDLSYVDLEESDKILDKIREVFPSLENIPEMIKNKNADILSLTNTLKKSIPVNDACYIFSDDVYECGMFKTNTKSALDRCFEIAFQAQENTCFITDSNFKYSITVNYNDVDDRDYPDTFEI